MHVSRSTRPPGRGVAGGNPTRKVSVFVAVLCHSRLLYIEFTLSQRKAILADLFGEQAAGDAVLAFAERMGRIKDLGQTRYAGNSGRLILPGAALLTGTRAHAMPQTRYFGGPLK